MAFIEKVVIAQIEWRTQRVDVFFINCMNFPRNTNNRRERYSTQISSCMQLVKKILGSNICFLTLSKCKTLPLSHRIWTDPVSPSSPLTIWYSWRHRTSLQTLGFSWHWGKCMTACCVGQWATLGRTGRNKTRCDNFLPGHIHLVVSLSERGIQKKEPLADYKTRHWIGVQTSSLLAWTSSPTVSPIRFPNFPLLRNVMRLWHAEDAIEKMKMNSVFQNVHTICKKFTHILFDAQLSSWYPIWYPTMTH